MFSWFANPHRFLKLSGWLAPAFYVLAAVGILWGLWQGLWIVPKDDYQGGDIMRVMFIHVPAAWLAMASYLGMAVMSFVWFIWRHEVADIAAKAIAPLGATWTALCLATGAIWGKPTWGTWWQWDDARMMSVLFMFFLFLGYMALRAAMDTRQKAARAGAILAMVGALNVPLIKFSVDLFTSLHQDASVITAEGPKMAAVYLWPLLISSFGHTLLFAALVMTFMRAEIWTRRAAQLRARLMTGD
ncbi:MAG: heme transporter HemC [Hyphomonas sp.]|uniref:Heme exporter protein C n=1 Tax=Hyphomonas atlantica TaxID=1280948 RepID=A0A353L3X9_9PROT|nr:heme ABC transporter permease CcmC [Hyphomonas sp.]OUX85164.1 MAG: heme transporter HemC [Hyphomonas sp. TMED31]HBF90714.1 heme transporter HemC [Hyphomonas atlantica]MAH93426.1 heme transporter HemC [Hyphomonas sp.]HBH45640.1 heme transporter HemC [Hyphomonas atlantica]HBQ49716.1 heme transporter HemC [Hyphomonas atlantica]|tara:strand:+ start:1480 stop:2211 length:732 start_codon:yes stop_codon:yes gene_type:complete